MKAPAAVMRKLGPLPVWGWAALALVSVFVFMRVSSARAAGAGTQLPYTPPASASSQAQQPASGQGDAADNMNSDLLSALGDSTSSYDALLAALQGGGYGISSAAPTGSGGSTASASVAAPTIDSGANNAPAQSYQPGDIVPQSGTGDVFTGGAPGGIITTDPEHNAFVTGQSDVDPFGVQTYMVQPPQVQNATVRTIVPVGQAVAA